MSLRTRILLLVTLTMLAPAILLGARFFQNRSVEIESALAALTIQADSIANDLDEKIQGTAQLHFGLGRAVDLDSANRAKCSAFLSDVREEYPQYTGILTISPAGNLFCDSLQTDRELVLTDREYFQKALVKKDGVTLQPVFGRLTGISVLQIAYPARSPEGDLKFVLLASFNLQKFVDFHNRRLSDANILLVDKKGTVLVSPPGMDRAERLGTSIADTDLFRIAASSTDNHTTHEIEDADGHKQYWAAASTPSNRDAGLYVMVGISRERLVADANRRLYEEAFELLIVSILLGMAMWFLVEFGIRQQVARLAKMAQQLGAGDLTMRIAAPYPSGELGGLMRELNATAEALQQQHAAVDDLNKTLYHMAHFDSLTDLPNRAAFNVHFEAILERAATNGEQFAVLSIDLDRFKEANDVYGHAAGDTLLQEVARRLQATAAGAFAARIGGDEFTLIITEGTQPAAAAALADSLLAAFSDDFLIEDTRVRIGLSIGGAVFPIDGTDAKTLMVNADAALYRAKADVNASLIFFEPDMSVQLQERHALQQDLRLAIDRGELHLHYQPQVRSGEAFGFEALARWQCPKRGIVPPGKFIPIAEEYGLIIPLGEWVLREACREAASWPTPLSIAVNVSPMQFHHGDLPSVVHSILLETGLSPARLELEITEGVLIDDFSRALSILRRLKSLGVGIALDDFGTGYSSLSYLHAFTFDRIKIDRSFICDLDDNRNSMAIVRAVIGLGRSLDIPVLAEGVETRSQRTTLARKGCHELQGYLTGRPFPISHYAALVGRQAVAQQTKQEMAS